MRFQQVAPDHFKWLEQRTGVPLPPDAVAFAVSDEPTPQANPCEVCGKPHPAIRGMTAIGNFAAQGAYFHIALDMPMALRGLLPVLDLYFAYYDLPAAFALVRAGNERSHRLVESFGFERVTRFRGASPTGEDLVLYRLGSA